MAEGEQRVHPLSGKARLIESSGCSDIQDALTMGRKYGLTADDLDPATQDDVIKLMASAKSVGGQAAPKTSSKEGK